MVKGLNSKLPKTPDMVEQLYKEDNKQFITGYEAAIKDLQDLTKQANVGFSTRWGHGYPERIDESFVIGALNKKLDERIKEERLDHGN